MADRLQPERTFEVRVVDGGEPGSFEGYASVFGVVDTHGTVFDKGAFKKTLKERKGWLPIVWMHNQYEPIGRADVREDEKGLWVEGQLDLDVQRGAEVHSGMKKGYITEMSHSFQGVKEKTVEAEDKSRIPHFLEVKSFEVSPVTTNFASNSEAGVLAVRTEDKAPEPIVVSDVMAREIDRLDALLGKPLEGTFAGKPHKPGDHLREIHNGLTRMERALRSDRDGRGQGRGD